MMMKRGLLIGDDALSSQYHPLDGIDCEIKEVLQDLLDIVVVRDYGQLCFQDLQSYDILIDYSDNWEQQASMELSASVLSYIAQGGAVLSIHQGIIKKYDLASVYGGMMVMHPPYTRLIYQVDARHGIIGRVQENEDARHGIKGQIQKYDDAQHATGGRVQEPEWSLEEEPYVFEMDALMEPDIFLWYQYGAMQKPAGWTRRFGMGRVCYLSPGHNIITFQDPNYRKLLYQCTEWMLHAKIQNRS